jgi:hypothetical protein
LYNPELVTVVVGSKKREFRVLKALICLHSAYFEKAFQKSFIEGQEGRIELEEVSEWLFECFVGWLYTNSISWDPTEGMEDPSGPSGLMDEHGNRNNRDEPLTWAWGYLYEVFNLADRYDTRVLRNAIVLVVQAKAMGAAGSEGLYGDCGLKFPGLPGGSTLHRFILDVIAYGALDSNAIDLDEIPQAALAKIARKAMQLSSIKDCEECRKGKPCRDDQHEDVKSSHYGEPWFRDPCKYHEHTSEDERGLCRGMMRGINERYFLDMELDD